MATVISGVRPAKFVPALNVPQIVAIAAIPGRLVPSEFGPSEVLFSLVDGRPWYVPQVIADEIYAIGVRPRQQIEVTAVGKKKTEVQIAIVQERLPQRARERDYTPELEQSLRNVNGPEPYWADTSSPIPAQTATATTGTPNGNPPPPSKTTAAAACMMASMCSAVDAIIEVQAYATRKGIGLTFSEESVRAIGLSIYIDACRHGVR